MSLYLSSSETWRDRATAISFDLVRIARARSAHRRRIVGKPQFVAQISPRCGQRAAAAGLGIPEPRTHEPDRRAFCCRADVVAHGQPETLQLLQVTCVPVHCPLRSIAARLPG